MNILIGILDALLILSSFFLVCLVLIQRGKGGGLAGAFGGVGGSSAFGTKAGDVFTKVTMFVAGFWILLCMTMVLIYNRGSESAWGSDSATTKVTKDAAAGTGAGSKSKSSSSSPASAPSSAPAPAGSAAAPLSPAPIESPAIPTPSPSPKK